MNSEQAPPLLRPHTRQLLTMAAIIVAASVALLYDWLHTSSPAPTQPHQTSDVRKDIESDFRQFLQNARQAAAQGELHQALQSCDAALQLTSADRIEANLLKADLLFRLHRHTEMRQPLEYVLQQDPDHAAAHAMLAHSLRLTGDLETALTHVHWFFTHQPEFLPARRIHAEVLRDQGETDRAIQEIRDVIALGSTEPDSHLLLAELLMYQRRFDEALNGLLPLQDVFALNHRYVATMARLCQVLNRDDDAAHYRMVLEQLRRASGPEDVSRIPASVNAENTDDNDNN